ncbi:hypothetical protein M501DRAFT_925592 [Patellaria atrata CBS 101060]|uniref:Exonuclease domain-containing protein n=1 Tax=Patellaria atrata CBS 101060 TaxID=1346257 RepID=A0A9P4SLA1_9PEZI|nr:hypothetical protein M501DRAFT_925592 [Patellaria atrata CBS 101060]
MAIITQSEAYLVELRNLIEPEDVLRSHGYIIRPLTDEQLLSKRRCLGCNKTISQLTPSNTNLSDQIHPTDVADKTVQVPAFRCKYHPGQVVRKHWSCCSQHVTANPCGGSDVHIPRSYGPGELAEQHQFHPTPDALLKGNDIRAAVALDCEMGTAVSGDRELIRVTLIDYFSGAVLVDNIVQPDVPMQHLNTRFSGVSWADVRKAKREGSCLNGKAGARRALWTFVGPETVVVGHGASGDLRALRWIHGRIVDSFVTESNTKKRREAANGDKKQVEAEIVRTSVVRMSERVPDKNGNENVGKKQKNRKKGAGSLSLKTLVKTRLDRDIQTRGREGHDSLEDAIAARDLIHWIISNPVHE